LRAAGFAHVGNYQRFGRLHDANNLAQLWLLDAELPGHNAGVICGAGKFAACNALVCMATLDIFRELRPDRCRLFVFAAGSSTQHCRKSLPLPIHISTSKAWSELGIAEEMLE
jgi:hypothetical protein